MNDHKSNKSSVNYPDSIDTRVALLEQSIGMINQTLIRIENKVDRSFDEIKELRKEMKSDHRWLLSIIGGLIAGLGAIIAAFTGFR